MRGGHEPEMARPRARRNAWAAMTERWPSTLARESPTATLGNFCVDLVRAYPCNIKMMPANNATPPEHSRRVAAAEDVAT